MDKQKLEQRLEKLLDSTPYISNTKVHIPNQGYEGNLEFTLVPDKKKQGLNKKRLERLISDIKEKMEINYPGVDFREEIKEIEENKIKYIVYASLNPDMKRYKKEKTLSNMAITLYNIISRYLYKTEHIKKPS